MNGSERIRGKGQAEKRGDPEYNSEGDLERLREWQENNPKKHRQAKNRRRQRKRSLPSTLTAEEWEDTLDVFGHKCVYCGSSGELHQDHFVPVAMGGGYTADNIVPACPECNHKKNATPPKEFCTEEKYNYIISNL